MTVRIADRGKLLQLLIDYFSEDDLKTLCYELDIDYDTLEGGSKTGKARGLIEYCENRDRLSELAAALRKARSTIHIPITLDVVATATPIQTSAASVTPAQKPRLSAAAKMALIGGAGVLIVALALFVIQSLLRGSAAPSSTPQPSAELTEAAMPATTIEPAQATQSTRARMVESFEAWTNPLPANVFIVDRDVGNDAHLSVTDDPAHTSGSGARALQLTYTISNTDPDPIKNYVGFEHVLPSAQDWSAYSQFCASVEADASTPGLTFRFGGEYPNTDYTLVELQAGRHEYCVPVQRATNYANLKAITSYQFYVDGTLGQREATIYIDDVRLVP